MVYRNCRVLPLYIFNEIFTTTDLTTLIKKPEDVDKVSAEELETIWQDILQEYDTLNSNFSSKKQYKDSCEIVFLQTKLTFLRVCVILSQVALSQEQQSKMEEILKGYNVKDPIKDIDSVNNLLSIKKSEFESNYKKEKKDKKSLDYNIARVSKFVGYRVDKFTVTVSEWVELLKMVDEQIAEQKKWQKK